MVPETRPRRATHRVTVLGVMLVAVGAALLLQVGWQLFGTTWLSERRHHAVVAELDEAWAAGRGTVTTASGPSSAVLRIPRWGPSYAVPVIAGTDDETLAAGFGLMPGSVEPGEVGNYALAGHRITHGEPLRRMPELETGDEVVISTRDTDFVYRLVTDGDALVVPMTQTWVLSALPHNPDGGPQPPQVDGQRLLTLTTCAELFHTDERMVAFAVLDEARAR